MYYIVFPLLYLVSLLPLRVLYLLSDLLYFFLYFVVRYRRRVVLENLRVAFPEKTEQERAAIARRVLASAGSCTRWPVTGGLPEGR